jgi:hypothetical protein
MTVEGPLESRHIERTKDFTVGGVSHDGGGAGPRLGPETEVLAGMHLHRPPEGERRADRVRSAVDFAPIGPRHEANVEAGFQRTGVPLRLQDHTRRIGEHHDRPRLREEIVRLRHDPHARFDEVAMAAAEDGQFFRGNERGGLGAAGVHGRGDTPLPRALDDAPETV